MKILIEKQRINLKKMKIERQRRNLKKMKIKKQRRYLVKILIKRHWSTSKHCKEKKKDLQKKLMTQCMQEILVLIIFLKILKNSISVAII